MNSGKDSSRTALTLAILILTLVMGAGCDTGDGGLTGGDLSTPGTGTVKVTVAAEGSPISGSATVRLTGPIERTATGTVGATLTFTDLLPGSYMAIATISSVISCEAVSAVVRVGETTVADIVCTRQIGTITGTITSGDTPISRATVKLTGPTSQAITTTGPEGNFSFVAVVGENTLTTFAEGFTCPVRTVVVGLNQETTADISCSPKTTGTIRGRVVVGDSGVQSALVTVTGPANLTATTMDAVGSFAFDDVAPGVYTLAATYPGLICPAVSADVQAARTTDVLITCSSRPPMRSEIEGEWGYVRLLRSQIGSCPPPLPETGTGSMKFATSGNAITILGLDPDLTISGTYDEDSGFFAGTGTSVSSDGSSIQTDLAIRFAFFSLSEPYPSFSTDHLPSEVMSRKHRDPAGQVVCTEVYGAGGLGPRSQSQSPWDY